MNDNIIQIINALIQKNTNRETIWVKTSGANEYKMQLNNATLTIDMWASVLGDDFYEISIYNGTGERIEHFQTSKNGDSYDFELLKKLYESTVDTYLKKGETINDILSQLNEEGIVGNHNKK